MTTEITIDDVNEMMAAAVTAHLAGDFASAERYAGAAQGYLSVIPEIDVRGKRTRWTPGAVRDFIETIRKAAAADAQSAASSGGITRTSMKYVSPSE